MTRDELADNIAITIKEYVGFDHHNQPGLKLSINPESLFVSVITEDEMLSDIADSNEAIEDAAAAERPESEDAMDYQVTQNPDIYPVADFEKSTPTGQVVLDMEAIRAVAAKYC